MKNLKLLFERADKSGLMWYNEANEFCNGLALKYGLSLSQVCGIVSALSPACNWDANKRDALGLIETYKGVRKYKHKFTTYGQNVVKAVKILNAEIEPGNAFSMKTGAKTYNFYHNLLEPNNDKFVTIDRHAFTIATGKPYTALRTKQYIEVANHYHGFARKLGVLPSQLQAVLWVDYRIKQEIEFKLDTPF